MKVKYKLSNKKERVILSDVLPYEVPVIFSKSAIVFIVGTKEILDFSSLVILSTLKIVFGIIVFLSH